MPPAKTIILPGQPQEWEADRPACGRSNPPPVQAVASGGRASGEQPPDFAGLGGATDVVRRVGVIHEQHAVLLDGDGAGVERLAELEAVELLAGVADQRG